LSATCDRVVAACIACVSCHSAGSPRSAGKSSPKRLRFIQVIGGGTDQFWRRPFPKSRGPAISTRLKPSRPPSNDVRAPAIPFVVIKRMPERDGEFEYRVRSGAWAHTARTQQLELRSSGSAVSIEEEEWGGGFRPFSA
jgi:hypothetical protein